MLAGQVAASIETCAENRLALIVAESQAGLASGETGRRFVRGYVSGTEEGMGATRRVAGRNFRKLCMGLGLARGVEGSRSLGGGRNHAEARRVGQGKGLGRDG